MAKRTAVGLNEIRKLINIEEKILQSSATAAPFDTAGALIPISRIAQGLDYTNRIGDSIKLQSIEVRARIFQNTSATTTVFRVLLVRDLDGYGTLPTVGNIMDITGSAGAPLSQMNWLNRKRFSVLYDEQGVLSTNGDRGDSISFKFAHEGHILYLGTTAAAASDGKGSLYLLFISDESTNTPTYAYQSRIVFTDD